MTELAALNDALTTTGRVPLNDEWPVFHAFAAEAREAVESVGSRMRGRFEMFMHEAFVHLPRDQAPKKATPPWRQAFDVGSKACEQLRDPETLVAAVEDAVDAACSELTHHAFARLMQCLDNVRAVAEFQGRRWSSASSIVEMHLTERTFDADGHRLGGRFAPGTSHADIWNGLRSALSSPPSARSYAVWLATLAGPGGLEQTHDAAVSGPIASSGIPCTGPIDEWATRVRSELGAAFAGSGLEIPRDVMTFGLHDSALRSDREDPTAFWADVGSPASFVTRVAVEAFDENEAIRMARRALAAVFGRRDRALANDIRPDARVWTESYGWRQPTSTDRDFALGEVFGARKAGAAVVRWASDLGSPLDQGSLDLLESRALTNDTSVALDVRVLRAWTSIETLAPRGVPLRLSGSRQWLHATWGDARSGLQHLFWNVALNISAIGPLRADASWDSTVARVERLRSQVGTDDGPLIDAGLLDHVRDVFEDVHPQAMSRIPVDVADLWLHDPDTAGRAKAGHAAAWGRAQRHRNLIAHGWRLPPLVLGPTVAFLAAQLELAVIRHGSQHAAYEVLGGLDRPPEEGWSGRSIAELLTEVANHG